MAEKPLSTINVNTSRRANFYPQGQQRAARILRTLTLWLLASCSLEGTLAVREPCWDLSQVSSSCTLQDSPEPPYDNNVASTPAMERCSQSHISQEATPNKPLPFQARGGESVRFYYQQGQWRAKVSSRIGPFSRQTVLPVVCSQGENVASSLEVLSRYPSWQRQRQIHVLDRNVCPTLGEVVYVGELGLKGGGPIPSFCDSIGCSSSVLSNLQVELENSDYGRFRTTVDPNSCMRPHTFPSNIEADGAASSRSSTSPCGQCQSNPYYQPLDFDLPTTRVADIRLGYFCHPFIVGVAADSADASRSHTASSASASCLSVDLGNQGIVQLYQHDGNWRTYCQKYNIHGWLRASKRKQLSIHDLRIYRIIIHTCRDCCLPCVVLTPPKYAANQPSAADPPAKWRAVTYEGKLALQEVDGGAFWFPKGNKGRLVWDMFTSNAPQFRKEAFRKEFSRNFTMIGPLLIPRWSELFRDCPFFHPVCVADDDDDAEENTPNVDLNLDSGEAVRFYPVNGKVWAAYIFEHDIFVEARASFLICLSAKKLNDQVANGEGTIRCSYHFCRVCHSNCVIVNISEEELSKVCEQSKKQQQEARHRREEQRRLEEQRKQEAARKALVQEVATQAAAEASTHTRQCLIQSPEEQRQQTRLLQALKHLREQDTDQQALTPEAMVTSSADVGLTDHQAHPTAAQDQDTPQPLAAAHRENPIPAGCQPPQAKHKQLDPKHQLTPQQTILLQLPRIVLPFVTNLQQQISDSLASESSSPEHQRRPESPVTELCSEVSSSSQPLSDSLALESSSPEHHTRPEAPSSSSQPPSDSLALESSSPEHHTRPEASSASNQPPRESWQTLEDLLTHYPEDLPTEAKATFTNTIVPLLQEQWPFIAPALQQTILDYFAHRGVLYPQILQHCPASQWVSQSIMQDLVQEALATNNPILRDQFLSAILPLQQSQPATLFTQFLIALQKKQQQHSLHLSDLCQILAYLPPHADEACTLVQQPNDTWIAHIKAAWLQPRLASLSPRWDSDQCQNLQKSLTDMPWSAALTTDFLDALQKQEQDYPATKGFLNFLSQHPLQDATLTDILRRGPPQDGSSPCQRWHREAACSILAKPIEQLFPTHAIALQNHTATLLQQDLRNYDTLAKLFLQLLKAPTNATQRTAQGQELSSLLAMLVDYQATADLVKQALAILTESPVNQWAQTVHQLLVDATFQDAYELTPEDIAASIAQSAPQANFAGDQARLLASYHALMATYQKTSSLLPHEAPIANWESSQVNQWAHKVKKSPQKVSQNEMLAVIQHAVKLQHGFLPRVTQLMSVLVLLNPAQNTGRLAQINTGEGKSLILAMLAAFHALQGQYVDIITSANELAIPEARKQQPFFNMLSLTVDTNSVYGKSDAEKAKIYKNHIVYGTAENCQADTLRTEFLRRSIIDQRIGTDNQNVVIVDEVDNLLVDGLKKNTFLYGPMPGMDRELEVVLATIWHQVHFIASRFRTIGGATYWVHPIDPAPDVLDENKILVEDKVSFIKTQSQAYLKSLLRELTPEERKQLKDYEERTMRIDKLTSTLAEASSEQRPELEAQHKGETEALEAAPWKQAAAYLPVPPHLQEFARSQIPHWIDNAILALFYYKKDQHYVVLDGKIVPIDCDTGELQHNTAWGDGLLQFLQIKEGWGLQPEAVPNNFISRVGYFKRYKNRLYGVTGTLGNPRFKEVLEQVYQIDTVMVPSYKERQIADNTHSAYRCKELRPLIFSTEKRWSEAILESALRHARNGQAVLIICKYIRQVQELKKRLQSVYDPRKIFTYDGKHPFNKNKVAASEIIIATNIAGRGTDLESSPEVEARGGLHVCITTLQNSRVELQNAGRTARQGQKGTAQLILWHPKKGMTIEELRRQLDQQQAAALEKAQSDEIFKDAKGDRTQAIAQAKLNGLHHFFTIEGRQPVPYRDIVAVASIGLTQIAVGCWLTSCSLGAAAPVSQQLILGGVSDLLYAANAECGLMDWVKWKGTGLVIAFGSAGVGYGIAQMSAAQTTTQTLESTQTFAKILQGVKKAVQNPGRFWNTGLGFQGVIIAGKRISLELGKGIAKECVNTLIDYGIDTTLIPAIEQKILKQVTKQITEAFQKNNLVIELLAQNNDWPNRLKKAGLELLVPEKNSELREISQTIVEGIISNQGQNIALLLQGTKMIFASQRIYTMTGNFLKNFDKKITTQYAHHLQKSQEQTQNAAQQQVASAPPLDEDQIEVHPVHMDQDYKSDLSAYYYGTPSSPEQLARVLAKQVARQMTCQIKNTVIKPVTRIAVSTSIDRMIYPVENAVQIQEEEYQAKGDVHQVGEQMAKEKQPQSQQATDDPQDAQATSDGPSQTDTSQRGGLAEVGAAAKHCQHPIALHDEHGRLINIIGRNLPGKPIKIQHTPSADGLSGHWESYGTDAKATCSGKNNCFYDAIACQVPGMDGAQLRVAVEKRIANSKYAQDLHRAVRKLEAMNPGALRRGGCYEGEEDLYQELQIEIANHKNFLALGDYEAAKKSEKRIQELEASMAWEKQFLEGIISWVPVVGSLYNTIKQYQEGNTGQTAFYAVMTGVDVVGVGWLAKGGLKLVWVGGKQVLKEVAVREVVHQGERQALKVGAEVAGKAVTETKLLPQFTSVESLINFSNFGKLRKSNQALQAFIRGNGENIFLILSQRGEKLPSGAIRLLDGTELYKHFSKMTGEFTLDINKAGQIYKIRINP